MIDYSNGQLPRPAEAQNRRRGTTLINTHPPPNASPQDNSTRKLDRGDVITFADRANIGHNASRNKAVLAPAAVSERKRATMPAAHNCTDPLSAPAHTHAAEKAKIWTRDKSSAARKLPWRSIGPHEWEARGN